MSTHLALGTRTQSAVRSPHQRFIAFSPPTADTSLSGLLIVQLRCTRPESGLGNAVNIEGRGGWDSGTRQMGMCSLRRFEMTSQYDPP
jgi:hypothetical protein